MRGSFFIAFFYEKSYIIADNMDYFFHVKPRRTSMVKQLSLFPNKRLITPVLSKCWYCGEFFPLSSIRQFDAMYPSGHVGAYQACDACYKHIKAAGHLVFECV